MADPVQLDDLHVTRDGAPVLRGLSLSLGPAERLAIVGSNGAGKTTLLRAIVGLQAATGTVQLFGQRCAAEADFAAARPHIGFLFQDSDDQLFCPTVLEDVCFGPRNLGRTPAQAEAAATRALAGLGVAHLADRVAHRLSGGEKRLVCLAGLLAMDPAVLLLDEPTNGVDAANGARLHAALAAFPGALILVSHDAAFVASLASRAALLEAGRLVPAEIHDHPHTHAHPHLHKAAP
ncbi:energy-coupling factor ABC transporter ATP-binding protein [Meridianimarinicoccus sp. RP-17]|uniref:energy-coupling factor ABC transporter ATP-binding protein n=1 Tax=Meridianimarinicoccus zhengii TaxID=2056810 RepID=UPI000DAF09DB|nr:ABC transporter ATP-binding protein [Phycocomes zhengii]